MKHIAIALLVILALPALALAADGDEAAVSSACNSGSNLKAPACIRQCGIAESTGKIRDFSRAMSSSCRAALRDQEVKSLKGSACGEGSCIIRLRKSGGAYAGGGYRLVISEHGSPRAGNFRRVATVSGKSAITFESFCGAGSSGSCEGFVPKSGASRGASLTYAGNDIVLTLPK